MEQHLGFKVWSCLGLMLGILALTGCGTVSENRSVYSDSPFAATSRQQEFAPLVPVVEQGRPIADFYPENLEPKESRKMLIKLGLGREEALAFGCNLGNRFDNGSALAYQFDDRQSRVSLHLSLDGPSLSEPGNIGFNSVMVRYTHKFQKPPKGKDEKCLYPSKIQGLIGSAYNEFFVRTNYTILDELKDRGLDLK